MRESAQEQPWNQVERGLTTKGPHRVSVLNWDWCNAYLLEGYIINDSDCCHAKGNQGKWKVQGGMGCKT
jgi:hypothetical protein